MKEQRRTLLALPAVLMLACCLAMADTYVGGLISSDTHWTAGAGPYIVQQSIAVIGGANLTIDPGVEVRFEPDKALVVDSGTLVSRGTDASPIRFTANQAGPSLQRWGYLQFSDGAVDASFDANGNYVSGCILEDTIVEYAGSSSSHKGAVRAISSAPCIKGSSVKQNATTGLYIENGPGVRILGNAVANNTGNGIHLLSSASSVLISNSVTHNSGLGEWGGGILVQGSPSSTLTANSVVGNSAVQYGGGIAIHYSDWCNVRANEIAENTVGCGPGGGVYLGESNSCTLEDNTITNNSSPASYGAGGGLFAAGSYHTVKDNTISGNTTGGPGAGMWLAEYSGCSTVAGNIITNNTAGNIGGGILFAAGNSLHVNGNTIAHNTSGGNGGGIFLGSVTSLVSEDNTFEDNTAIDGGGLFALGTQNVALSGDRFIHNHVMDPNGTGGVRLGGGTDRWDFTGPDDPNNPVRCVWIYGNDGYQLYNDNAFSGSFDYKAPGNVDARYIYWGATDEAAIRTGIYDFFDNGSKGIIFYAPYAVPEPATLSLLAVGGLVLIRRRRK